ncbi:MAG: TlyA family RNA methyltransferase [Elusimicrobia bacterium]|nr:TlyA family RNA methyltransferase [Candidatus Obscuribacterium magneticum]
MKPPKTRLDLLLVDKGLARSHTQAQALILAGQVRVKGQIVLKAGTLLGNDAELTLHSLPRYVSRGGDKLEGALEDFHLSPRGRIGLDVGSSTGGFTDCLLQQGAVLVHAIDVGKAQMIQSIKKDPRVRLREKTHILSVTPETLVPPPDLAVIDVSFISLKKVLPKVGSLLALNGEIIALVKPQFEVGPKLLKKGVVKSPAIQEKAVKDLIQFCIEKEFQFLGQSPSKLKGAKGNQEYFLYLRKRQNP